MTSSFPLRQVHLDFHTSPWIPDVASEFDATAFAETFQRARVNSVTLFAKCHHGQCYYPTQTGTAHPALAGRDLLGEQLQALHRLGIRGPIYTPVVWEEDVAQRHPEWSQMTRLGHFAGGRLSADGQTGKPGNWRFNNFLDPDFQDYLEAHVRELFSRYGDAVDGLFFDILFFDNAACWSEASVRFRERHGLLTDDAPTFARFQAAAQGAFCEKFTRIVHGLRPAATVFYNAHNDGNLDPRVGPRMRAPHQTHYEIESLPSGFWGYHHFPRMARMISHWGKPWVGMTGRFQKMWGDFGGLKPLPALEYECFRAQALGGGNSIGDQLPPRGTPDAGAYDLIGRVYTQCEAAEPFYAGSDTLPAQIGIFTVSSPGFDGGFSEEGAVLMCEESHYDCAVLDLHNPALSAHAALILPDSVVVSPTLRDRLKAYWLGGGRLLLSARSGLDADGKWALDFLPLTHLGTEPLHPTYWRARAEFAPDLARSDRVFYEQGQRILPGPGAQVQVDRVLPYFQRSDLRFCSHFQTPPVAQADRHPAVIAGERFVYFADPIFREYRDSGNIAARDVWRLAVLQLIGEAPHGAGLPTTVALYPRRRGADLLLTLLHYIPVRKARAIDMIEERSSFAGETLLLPVRTREVRDFSTGASLTQLAPGRFALPATKGRLLLTVPDLYS
jgi:hypothetical protein